MPAGEFPLLRRLFSSRFLFLKSLLAGFFLQLADLVPGIHRAAAFTGAAAAGGFTLAIEQVVVVRELLAGLDVAHGVDPDPAIDLVGFAVGLAGMVDVHGHAVAIHHVRAAIEREKVRVVLVLVEAVPLFVGDSVAGVLDDARALRDWSGGVTAGSVDSGGADDQG